jgi:glycerol uptake facilitator-like aquaporin
LVPVSVGLYITATYCFTASTSFANPAVTVARAFSNTCAGIRPTDVPAFMLAQFLGAATALLVCNPLLGETSRPRHASVATARASVRQVLERQGTNSATA